MRSRRTVARFVAALVVAGCAGNPQPVLVVGEPASIANLAGRWTGSYSSSTTGRSGSIVFQLTAGRDTAFGDVLMTPAGAEEPLTRAGNGRAGERAQTRPRLLTISFVQIGGDRVFGKLDPYLDPDCGCELLTTFDGRIAGDVIEGTYATRHGHGGGAQQGSWRVKR